MLTFSVSTEDKEDKDRAYYYSFYIKNRYSGGKDGTVVVVALPHHYTSNKDRKNAIDECMKELGYPTAYYDWIILNTDYLGYMSEDEYYATGRK